MAIGKPRSLHARKHNCSWTGFVHGDVMRRRVQSRAVIAQILYMYLDLHVLCVCTISREKLHVRSIQKHFYYTVLEMPRPRVLIYGEQ